MLWTDEDQAWIKEMDNLMTSMLAVDFPRYTYEKKATPQGIKNGSCTIYRDDIPSYKYIHDEWEFLYSRNSPINTDLPVHCSSPTSTDKSDDVNTAPQDSPVHCSSPTSTDKSDDVNTAPQDSPVHCGSPTSTEKSDDVNTAPRDSPVHCSSPTSTGHANHSSETPLSICSNYSGLTRGEIASMNLPPTTFILSKELEIVENNKHHPTNPYVLSCRPPESIVDEALKMLRSKVSGEVIQDDEDEDKYLVRLGKLGYFTRDGLDVLKKFCAASITKRKVKEEMSWLKSDDSRIKDALLSLCPSEEFVSLGNRSMDATDFSNLAGERYVDGYTIDIACLNAIRQSNRRGSIIYLPSHTPIWAASGTRFLKEKLSQFVHVASSPLKIICPIHVGGCHWGLLYIDVEQMVAYYDDGMKIDPPQNICLVANNIVKVLELLGCNMFKQWIDLEINELRRMGMPQQPKGGEGSSSCGIGVIFAVRDIISCSMGVPHFTWSFKNSSKLRKTIIYELISLREGTSKYSN